MIYLIVTSFVWAFSYGLIKANLTSLDPNFVSFCRMAFAALVFLPFLRISSLKRSNALSLMAIGAIQYGLMYLCFLRSFQYLQAYQAALFTIVTPLYVIIINDLYSRKFSPFYMLIAMIAMVGGGVIYYQNINQANILQGFILVQLSDICFAFGQVAYKRFRTSNPALKDQKIYALLFMGAMFTALISTTLFSGWYSLNIITSTQLLVLLYLGAIASGLGFFLWNKGAVLTNTATLATFNNLKAPLAIAVSLIFFHESTSIPRLIISLTIIGIALFLSERHAKIKLQTAAT